MSPTGKDIVLRRIPGWEFCNENVAIWNANVHQGGTQALEGGNRKVAEWFIAVLTGCRKVIDIGCGAGFPSLYLAPHVDRLIGVDATPNMISAAKANAVKLGVENVLFEVGGADGLRFADGYFDGALLCGVLENMDTRSACRMIQEVWRVLSPRSRIAVIDQDWKDLIKHKPQDEWVIRSKAEGLMLQHMERTVSPHEERDTRYLVCPNSLLDQRLRKELGDKESAPTAIAIDDLNADNVLDAWCEENAQFDERTLKELATSCGFCNVKVESTLVWSQQILFLTGTKHEEKDSSRRHDTNAS